MSTSQVTEWANKHFLLIDDFSSMRIMLQGMLRTMGVRYVDQAANGSEAVAMLGRNKYDVVLCDFNLGTGKNGQQVLEEAKVLDLIGPTCIWLMVSAEKSVEFVLGAAEYQPDGYLVKPITESILLARLARIWSKKQVFKAIALAYDAKDYLKAIRLCDEKLLTDKLNALDLMRLKASLLLKSGEPELARSVFEQVLAERDFAWAKTGIAKIRLENGEVEEAKMMLQRVIADNPHHLEAYDHLAAAQQKLGEFADAQQVLQNATKLSPNSVLRQKTLGAIALRLGNIDVAERAFRKSVEVGEHSVLRTPDSYLGLARVCGQKNDSKEALKLLATVQSKFDTEEVRVRAKISEGLVYHESGDFMKARKSGEELGQLLTQTSARPDPEACLDMARLLFAVGTKDAAVELLREVVKNNHDNDVLAADVQQIFDKAKMSEEGMELVGAARQEANEMMDRGVILWKEKQYTDALEAMRAARTALPSNVRILLNCAQIFIAYMKRNGCDPDLVVETREVLRQVDKLAPNQRRFAQLMEQLEVLSPSIVSSEGGN